MIGYDKILEELQRRVAAQPALRESVSLSLDLIAAQARVPVNQHEYGAIAQIAPSRFQRGLPVLAPETFCADRVALVHLCEETCAIAAQHRPELALPLDDIRKWFVQKHDSILPRSAEHLRGASPVQAEEFGLDCSLLTFVFNNAMHPFLRVYAQVVAPFVNGDEWFRPRCPVCGGEPDFASLSKATGARHLLCTRCDFEWAFWRGACPFCECDDPDQQRFFISNDRAYRLYTCGKCQRYLKTIDLRQVEDERILPAERVLTLSMDIAARKLNFAGTSLPA